MVLLSHSPSLAVILSITLFTCNHMIVIIVSLLEFLNTIPGDTKTGSACPRCPTSAASRSGPRSRSGQCGRTFSLQRTLFFVSLLHLPEPLTLRDHPAGNPLRLLRGDLQQLAEALQRDVVVELGGGQQVVLDHGVLQDRHPVRHHRLLVSLQQSLK